MTNTVEIIKELSGYTAAQWMDWVEDILYYKIAYPVSNLTSDGDALVDMYIFLKTNNISPKNYEKGLISVLNKLLGVPVDEIKIIQILDAMIISKSERNKEILKDVLFRSIPTPKKLNHQSLKSKALQGLSRLKLETIEKNEIKEYLFTAGWEEFTQNSSLVGNYLRLIMFNSSPQDFFSCVTSVISSTKDKIPENAEPYMVSVIEDKFREFHENSPQNFFKYFYQWVVEDYKVLVDCPITGKILSKFYEYLKMLPDPSKLTETHSEELHIGKNMTKVIYYLSYDQTWTKQQLPKVNQVCSFLIDTHGDNLFYFMAKMNLNLIFGDITVYKNIFLFKGESYDYDEYYPFIKLYSSTYRRLEGEYNKFIEMEKQELSNCYE